jgi:hypothetical protein
MAYKGLRANLNGVRVPSEPLGKPPRNFPNTLRKAASSIDFGGVELPVCSEDFAAEQSLRPATTPDIPPLPGRMPRTRAREPSIPATAQPDRFAERPPMLRQRITRSPARGANTSGPDGTGGRIVGKSRHRPKTGLFPRLRSGAPVRPNLRPRRHRPSLSSRRRDRIADRATSALRFPWRILDPSPGDVPHPGARVP